MAYWGNNANVEAYMVDRAIPSHELILVLEYIPHVLESWLHQKTDIFQTYFEGLCAAIAFLRTKGIIHFDTHFRNVLTDEEQIYLTDFGLVLDQNFSPNKR